MNFDFSDDQKSLKANAQRFLSARCPLSRVRRVLDDPDRNFDAELWRLVADQGWLGATIPEIYGGLGLGYLELCVLAEELGRALAPIPFSSSLYMFAEAVMLTGDERQKSEILPKIATGEIIGALAVSEAGGTTAPNAIQATVKDGKLTGEKIPVTDGGIAGHCVVLAREDSAATLFLVDLNATGVERQTLKTLDPTRNAARIVFKEVSAERLGHAGMGWVLLEKILDRAAVLLAFEQLGGADYCLDMAKTYAMDRYAFGRKIGAYQAIKHKLADIYVKNELARSSAYFAAWALSINAAELPAAASAARIAASDAYWYAAKENIQTHGGIGYTWEMDCHLFYRRSQQLALVVGAPRVWKERLVRHLERQNTG